MNEYQQTTGKVYEGIAAKCTGCGNIFKVNASKKNTPLVCDKCKGEKCVPFNQTTAKLPNV
jgi:predicted Zn-ribbon and HTH transcriptional regulator